MPVEKVAVEVAPLSSSGRWPRFTLGLDAIPLVAEVGMLPLHHGVLKASVASRGYVGKLYEMHGRT